MMVIFNVLTRLSSVLPITYRPGGDFRLLNKDREKEKDPDRGLQTVIALL